VRFLREGEDLRRVFNLFQTDNSGLIVGIAVVTCAGEKRMVGRSIGEVLKEHTDRLMSLPGVVGTAQGLCLENPV